MLDIGTAKVDRCVITQAITKTTLVGFEHALEIVSLFKMDLGWEKDIYKKSAKVTILKCFSVLTTEIVK